MDGLIFLPFDLQAIFTSVIIIAAKKEELWYKKMESKKGIQISKSVQIDGNSTIKVFVNLRMNVLH